MIRIPVRWMPGDCHIKKKQGRIGCIKGIVIIYVDGVM